MHLQCHFAFLPCSNFRDDQRKDRDIIRLRELLQKSQAEHARDNREFHSQGNSLKLARDKAAAQSRLHHERLYEAEVAIRQAKEELHDAQEDGRMAASLNE